MHTFANRFVGYTNTELGLHKMSKSYRDNHSEFLVLYFRSYPVTLCARIFLLSTRFGHPTRSLGPEDLIWFPTIWTLKLGEIAVCVELPTQITWQCQSPILLRFRRRIGNHLWLLSTEKWHQVTLHVSIMVMLLIAINNAINPICLSCNSSMFNNTNYSMKQNRPGVNCLGSVEAGKACVCQNSEDSDPVTMSAKTVITTLRIRGFFQHPCKLHQPRNWNAKTDRRIRIEYNRTLKICIWGIRTNNFQFINKFVPVSTDSIWTTAET
jgi:hypothetical protein